jgi:hypothetical protein
MPGYFGEILKFYCDEHKRNGTLEEIVEDTGLTLEKIQTLKKNLI